MPASGSKKLRLRLSVGSEDSGEPKPIHCDSNTAENKENMAKEAMPHPADDEGVPVPPAEYQQHPQVRKESGGRSHRRQGRTMSASQADCPGVAGRNSGKRRQGLR